MHVKTAVALARLGKLEAAVQSLRIALGLEFDIELADAIGRLDGIPDGAPLDLAAFLSSWQADINADEEEFDIVVEGFEERRASLTGSAQDDPFGVFHEEPAAESDEHSAPTVPIHSADPDRARAMSLGRTRYAGVAPPPPAHRRGGQNAEDDDSAHDGFEAAPSNPGAAAEVEWPRSAASSAPSAGSSSDTGTNQASFDDFDLAEDRREPTDRLRWPEAIRSEDASGAPAAEPALAKTHGSEPELPHTGQRFAADSGAVTVPPAAAVPDWGEQPSIRRAPPTLEQDQDSAEADRMASTPLPQRPVRENERETPAMHALDSTPLPSYYDPLRDAPSHPTSDQTGGFGVVRNSSVRKGRGNDPTPTAPAAPATPSAPRSHPEPVPARVDEMLAAAVQHMRRGDLSLADAMIDRVLEREPRNAEGLNLRNGLRKQLANLRMRALEPLERIPRQDVRAIMDSGQSLNPRRMFILSLVDGTMSLRDIIDLSGSSSDEASELLLSLVDQGLIVFR